MFEKAQTEITHDACLGFFVTFIQRDEEERAGVRCNKVSTSLTLSRTEGIAVERIPHLNTEFPMLDEREVYRLILIIPDLMNLSISSRLRAPNQNLQFIVNLMLPINAVLHGFLNPCNRSLGVAVADIGPGLIIASI